MNKIKDGSKRAVNTAFKKWSKKIKDERFCVLMYGCPICGKDIFLEKIFEHKCLCLNF